MQPAQGRKKCGRAGDGGGRDVIEGMRAKATRERVIQRLYEMALARANDAVKLAYCQEPTEDEIRRLDLGAVAEAEALEDSVAVVAASVALAEEAVEVAVQVEAGKIVMLFFITWYNTQKWLVNSAVSRSPTGFERSLMKRVSLNFFQNYNMAKILCGMKKRL